MLQSTQRLKTKQRLSYLKLLFYGITLIHQRRQFSSHIPGRIKASGRKLDRRNQIGSDQRGNKEAFPFLTHVKMAWKLETSCHYMIVFFILYCHNFQVNNQRGYVCHSFLQPHAMHNYINNHICIQMNLNYCKWFISPSESPQRNSFSVGIVLMVYYSNSLNSGNQ